MLELDSLESHYCLILRRNYWNDGLIGDIIIDR